MHLALSLRFGRAAAHRRVSRRTGTSPSKAGSTPRRARRARRRQPLRRGDRRGRRGLGRQLLNTTLWTDAWFDGAGDCGTGAPVRSASSGAARPRSTCRSRRASGATTRRTTRTGSCVRRGTSAPCRTSRARAASAAPTQLAFGAGPCASHYAAASAAYDSLYSFSWYLPVQPHGPCTCSSAARGAAAPRRQPRPDPPQGDDGGRGRPRGRRRRRERRRAAAAGAAAAAAAAARRGRAAAAGGGSCRRPERGAAQRGSPPAPRRSARAPRRARRARPRQTARHARSSTTRRSRSSRSQPRSSRTCTGARCAVPAYCSRHARGRVRVLVPRARRRRGDEQRDLPARQVPRREDFAGGSGEVHAALGGRGRRRRRRRGAHARDPHAVHDDGRGRRPARVGVAERHRSGRSTDARRLYLWKKLNTVFANESWARASVSVYGDDCYGHREDDQIPFAIDLSSADVPIAGDYVYGTGPRGVESLVKTTTLSDETTTEVAALTPSTGAAAGQYYSNAELMRAIDPRGSTLPYVYDTFKWEHCLGEGHDFDDLGRRYTSGRAARRGLTPAPLTVLFLEGGAGRAHARAPSRQPGRRRLSCRHSRRARHHRRDSRPAFRGADRRSAACEDENAEGGRAFAGVRPSGSITVSAGRAAQPHSAPCSCRSSAVAADRRRPPPRALIPEAPAAISNVWHVVTRSAGNARRARPTRGGLAVRRARDAVEAPRGHVAQLVQQRLAQPRLAVDDLLGELDARDALGPARRAETRSARGRREPLVPRATSRARAAARQGTAASNSSNAPASAASRVRAEPRARPCARSRPRARTARGPRVSPASRAPLLLSLPLLMITAVTAGSRGQESPGRSLRRCRPGPRPRETDWRVGIVARLDDPSAPHHRRAAGRVAAAFSCPLQLSCSLARGEAGSSDSSLDSTTCAASPRVRTREPSLLPSSAAGAFVGSARWCRPISDQ